jgi:hypothetical protein
MRYATYCCPDCNGITVSVGGHVYVEHDWLDCPRWAHVVAVYPCLARAS